MIGAAPLRTIVSAGLGSSLLVLLLAGLVSAPAAAEHGDSDAVARTDVEPLAACFAERQRLAVLMLIDESGSLQWTDPDNERVVALIGALELFASLRTLTGMEARLDVAMAAFATEYRLVRDWSELTDDTLPDFRRDAAAFADLNRGLDTDFALALDGARDEIDRHIGAVVSDGEAPPCHAVLLFTDGDYDIEPRGTPETRPYAPDLPLDVPGNAEVVIEAGRAYVCDPDGAIDRLRATGAPLITVAFTPDIAPEDRAFIEALSLGVSSDGFVCGADQREGLGAYLEADELDELTRAFHTIIGESWGGRPLQPDDPVSLCDGEACAEGRFEFVLDGSLQRAHLLANLVAEGVVMHLEGPTGDEVLVVDPADVLRTQLSGADLVASPLSATDVTVSFDLPADTDSWIGTWAVTLIDTTGRNAGALADAQVLLFGGLDLEVLGSPELRLGEPGTVGLRLVNQEGTPRVPDDVLGTTRVDATVTDPLSGRQQRLEVVGPDSVGTWEVTYLPPLDLGSTAVNLTATLGVTTPAGLELPPRSVNRSLPVLPPVEFPSVRPERLDLGTILGGGEASSVLTVIGAEQSAGCAWFEVGAVDAPRYAGEASIVLSPEADRQARCVTVGPGETVEVSVSIGLDAVDSGTASFPLTVFLASDDAPEIVDVALPASVELVREVDELRRIGLFIALLLPGIVLPLVLMYAVSWWTGRFDNPGLTLHAVYPVRVDEGGSIEGLRRNGLGEPLRLAQEDFLASDAPAGRVRRFETAGLIFRSRVSANPLGAPWASVSSRGADTLAAEGLRARQAPVTGVTGFALGGSWAFVVDQVVDDPDLEEGCSWVEGRLYVWRPEGLFSEDGPEIERRLLEEVPAAVGEFLRTRPSSPPEAPGPSSADDTPSEGGAPAGWRPASPSTHEGPDDPPAWIPPSQR